MSREVKILIVLLIISGIVFGALAYLNFKSKQEVAESKESEEIIADDIGLKEVLAQLDTLEKLIDYLNKNFIDKGDKDISMFASRVLDRHGYEAVTMSYRTVTGDIHTVTIFRDVDLPKYITITDKGIEMFAHGWSFEDFFQAEERRLNIEITDYAIFSPNTEDLVVDEWTERK